MSIISKGVARGHHSCLLHPSWWTGRIDSHAAHVVCLLIWNMTLTGLSIKRYKTIRTKLTSWQPFSTANHGSISSTVSPSVKFNKSRPPTPSTARHAHQMRKYCLRLSTALSQHFSLSGGSESLTVTRAAFRRGRTTTLRVT